MEDISSLAKKKIQKSVRKSGGVSATIGGVSHFFYTPETTGTINTHTYGSAQNPPTPKMSVLFKNGTNIKIGYYGKLEFLDNKAIFAEVFGYKPEILAPSLDTPQYSTSTSRRLYSFG